MATSRDIEAVLKLKDELSKNVQKANKELKALNKLVGKNHGELKKIGKSVSFKSITKSIIGAHVAMRAFSVSVRAVTEFFTGSVRASTEFNDAFTRSTAIMGELSDVMKSEMVDAAQTVARETTFSAKQGAEAYFFLASAGMDAAESIGSLPAVAKFAQAGTFELAVATDLLTDAQSALGLRTEDTAKNLEEMIRVSDVLVKANTIANASVEQFSQSLTNKAGAALKILGKDIEEGVAVLAAFADQGVKGAEAGTALNIVLRDLSTQAIKNKEAFAANKVAVFDAQGEMRNIGSIIADLEDRLRGMSDETAKATLQQLGFADKSVIFIQTLIGMSDKIKEYEDNLRSAGGVTEEVAAKQMESFKSQVQLVQNNWEVFIGTLGDFITQSEPVKAILEFIVVRLTLLTESLEKNNTEWTKFTSGGISLAVGAIEAFLLAIGLVITGIAKLGAGIVWIAERFGKVLAPALIEQSVAMSDSFTAFGESILRGAAEVHLLGEAVRTATDIQLAQTDAQDEGTGSAEALRDALAALESTFTGTGTATDNFTGGLGDAGEATGALKKELQEVIPYAQGFAQAHILISDALLASTSGIVDAREAFEGYIVPVKSLVDEMGRFDVGIGAAGVSTEKITKATVSWNEATGAVTRVLGDAGNVLSIFGVDVDSVLGKITRLISAFTSLMSSLGGLGNLLGNAGRGLGSLAGSVASTAGSVVGAAGPMLPAAGAGAGGIGGALGGVGSAVASGASSVMTAIGGVLAAVPVAGWIALAGIGTVLAIKAIFGGPDTFKEVGTEWGVISACPSPMRLPGTLPILPRICLTETVPLQWRASSARLFLRLLLTVSILASSISLPRRWRTRSHSSSADR